MLVVAKTSHARKMLFWYNQLVITESATQIKITNTQPLSSKISQYFITDFCKGVTYIVLFY